MFAHILSPSLADLLLNMALSAVILTTLATFALILIPPRKPRLRCQIVIGVWLALALSPAMRWALPQGVAKSVPLGMGTVGDTLEVRNIHEARVVSTLTELQATNTDSEQIVAIPAPSATMMPTIDWLGLLIAVWSIGAVIASARIAVGWWRLHRLAAALHPASNPDIRTLWRNVSRDSGESCALATSPKGIGLFTFGCRRPIVAIPEDLLSHATEHEALALLAHEWSHIQNHDALLGHFQRVVAAVYWWLPTVHWLNRQLSLCRETLADTAAAARVESPSLYAHSLLNLAAQACRKSPPAMGAIGIAGSRSALAQRLTTLNKYYEEMKANLHNPNPLRAPLAVLGVCSLCLAIQFTYAQEDVSSDSAPITEVASQAPAPLSELPQDSVPTPSADSIPLAPASPPVPPRPPIQQLPRVSVSVAEDRNVEISPRIPKTEIRFSDERLHMRSPEGELHFEGSEAEMHRALAKMQKELAKTQEELGQLQKELARARAEKDRLNLEKMSSNIGEAKKRDWLRAEAAAAAKDRGVSKAETAILDSIDALKSPLKKAKPKSRTLQTGAEGLQEQQRLLQETITQAVTEALRAATEEIRKELQDKALSSSVTETIDAKN